MSFDISSIFKSIAPMIAGTILGPFGGMAVNAIIGAVSPDAAGQITAAQTTGGLEGAVQKIQDLFTQGAIQAADIKKAELTHAEMMAQLGYKNEADLSKIAADDRDSARKREIAVKDNVPALLALLITTGFFGILIGMLSGWLHVTESDALLLMLGSLTTAWGGVVSYYYGTTKGSGDKDKTIAEVATK